jgi:hypothetical protein
MSLQDENARGAATHTLGSLAYVSRIFCKFLKYRSQNNKRRQHSPAALSKLAIPLRRSVLSYWLALKPFGLVHKQKFLIIAAAVPAGTKRLQVSVCDNSGLAGLRFFISMFVAIRETKNRPRLRQTHPLHVIVLKPLRYPIARL